MLELGATVRFRHPLVRSAIYGAAPSAERRAAHQALAEATHAQVDPDRRAWHRAQAALRPDEAVAGELERAAARAQARGGVAAAAAFLERAAALTPEPAGRARRALVAARAEQMAGLPQAASALLNTAAAGPLDEFDRAIRQRLQGLIALHLGHSGDAAPQLLDAARRLESRDARLARETHLEALYAATIAGRLGDGVPKRPPPPAPHRPPQGHRGPPTCSSMVWPSGSQRAIRPARRS